MPFRAVAIRAALLVGLCACGTDPETPYVVLRIEDPANVGPAATSLVLTDASGNASAFPTQSRVFPITVTLTSKRDGVQVVTVELLEGSRRIARGTASINVLVQRGREIAVSLDAICEGEDCSPPGPLCSAHEDCSDDLFCNGEERCEQGVCRSGPSPCAADKCDEQRGCDTTMPPVDCGRAGDQPCNDGLVCNGTETCVAGQCVDGDPPESAEQCRVVVCDEQDGVRETLAPDGTACMPTGQGTGVCYAGNCEVSPYTPQCDMFARFDPFAEGNIFGGPGHTITVNGVKFLQAESGYETRWTVTDDDLRPGSVETMGSPSMFSVAIADSYYLRSFRIRVASAQTCQFESSPSGVLGVEEVSSTSFITITLPEPLLSNPQVIHFNFQCSAVAPASPIRIDDFCLGERS